MVALRIALSARLDFSCQIFLIRAFLAPSIVRIIHVNHLLVPVMLDARIFIGEHVVTKPVNLPVYSVIKSMERVVNVNTEDTLPIVLNHVQGLVKLLQIMFQCVIS